MKLSAGNRYKLAISVYITQFWSTMQKLGAGDMQTQMWSHVPGYGPK